MRSNVRVAAASGALIAIAAIGMFWLLRPAADDLIPAAFQGIWLDKGAECEDASAQVRISATTINYDQLSFKADGVADRQNDSITLTGDAFPNGRDDRATVALRMQDHGTTLFVATRGLSHHGPFVRCSGADE